MSSNLLHNPKGGLQWIDMAFYITLTLLAFAVIGYLFLASKTYLQNQKINEIEKQIAVVLNSEQEKLYEREFLDYKNRVNDFASIINKRKVFSGVFGFLEKNTLPNVWFNKFGVMQSSNEINLSGQSGNMASLSRQIQVFEENRDYVKGINLLNSNIDNTGKVIFNLIVAFDPKIFK